MKQYTAIVTLIVTIIFIMSLKMRMPNQAISEQLALERKDQELMEYIRQRNNVSRLLNLRQQLVGQMECEVDTFIFIYHFFLHIFNECKNATIIWTLKCFY